MDCLVAVLCSCPLFLAFPLQWSFGSLLFRGSPVPLLGICAQLSLLWLAGVCFFWSLPAGLAFEVLHGSTVQQVVLHCSLLLRLASNKHTAPKRHRFLFDDGSSPSSSPSVSQPYAGSIDDRPSYLDFGDPDEVCTHCHARFWYEERCLKTSTVELPAYSLCCRNGRVKLHEFDHIPQTLSNLLDPNNGADSKHFIENIRIYNSMFAFTSVDVQIDESLNTGRGPYVFRVSGQLCHLLGSLLPSDDDPPRFAQLYMYDTENEIANRIAPFSSGDQSYTGDTLRLRIRADRSRRDSTYSASTAFEVAGLIVGDLDSQHFVRDIVVQRRSGLLQRVSSTHPSYMLFQYPLIFTRGEDGFTPLIEYNPLAESTQKLQCQHVTMAEFYCYRLHMRVLGCPIILKSGRLLQQISIDMFACVDQSRMWYIHENQAVLRSDTYTNVRNDVINNDMFGQTVGKRIILPSSHVGSPRYMYQNYQDAIAVCKHLGPPHLFITFTCNPTWPEITRNLMPGQHANDRPDLVCRVFKMKLNEMVHQIKDGEFFGNVSGLIYSVEFQKRGLPHVHIIVWSRNRRSLSDPASIDRFISAELPNPVFDPEGRDRAMVSIFRTSNTTRSPGEAQAHQETVIDEVLNYLNCRYLTAPEAIWRLFQYDIHYSYPTVERLPIHLPFENNIIFRDSEPLSQVINNPASQRTKLTAWFDLNTTNPAARQLTYPEVTRFFMWLQPEKKWKIREQGYRLAHVHFVQPSAGDVYYERMLLNIVRGATSFDHLRTINGILHQTYKEACNAYGLLEDNSEWLYTMQEAAASASSEQLRAMFVDILLYSEVVDAKQLWQSCWNYMADDIVQTMRVTHNNPELTIDHAVLQDYVLHKVEDILLLRGYSLQYVSLPVPLHNRPMGSVNRLLTKQYSYNTADLRMQIPHLLSGLNMELKRVLDAVIQSVHTGTGGLFFVYGHGGTGKTFLWRAVTALLRSEGDGTAPVLSLYDSTEPDWIKIPDCFLVPNNGDAEQAIIGAVYSDLQSNLHNDQYYQVRAIITPKNDAVTTLNETILKTIPGQQSDYLSYDTIQGCDNVVEDLHTMYPPDILNTITVGSLPCHKLTLKIGVPVMLLRNMDQSKGGLEAGDVVKVTSKPLTSKQRSSLLVTRLEEIVDP
ncbi:hypothetical protein LUZ63_001441 [Rhynchospora breviuscula]|uniref:ATP-dependent DNA helicase n=1 Tax=Rhynchospora breviuscula TaxID=2022672 RepID=A0A9Q0CXS7_9POAL|nr:hypothetical protein LUZ63_001441 [Rhynchospora breviuscula]